VNNAVLWWQQLTSHPSAMAIGVLGWLWLRVILPSDLSLVAAIPAYIGYRRGRRRNPDSWLWMMGGHLGLIVVALVSHQYGLLVSIEFARAAWQNWRHQRRCPVVATAATAIGDPRWASRPPVTPLPWAPTWV